MLNLPPLEQRETQPVLTITTGNPMIFSYLFFRSLTLEARSLYLLLQGHYFNLELELCTAFPCLTVKDIFFLLHFDFGGRKTHLQVKVSGPWRAELIIVCLSTVYFKSATGARSTCVRAFRFELEFGSVGFCGKDKTREPGEKRVGAIRELQQQALPTYDAGSGNRTLTTLVGGERFHHCITLAPLASVYTKSTIGQTPLWL